MMLLTLKVCVRTMFLAPLTLQRLLRNFKNSIKTFREFKELFLKTFKEFKELFKDF